MPESFVEGGSIAWGRLATTAIATVVIGVTSWVIGLIDLAADGLTTAWLGWASFIESYIGGILGMPGSVAGSAAREVISFLGILGPFAFAGSVVIMLLSGFVIYLAIERSIGLMLGAIS